MPDNVSGPELVRLKNIVEENFTASDWEELGALTDELDYIERHGRLLRSLRFGDDDYGGCVLSVLRTIIDSDDANLAIVKKYLSKKYPGEIEEGEDVSTAESNGRKIVFSPSVFKVPEDDELEENLVAVMMPFEGSFSAVYSAIKAAADGAGMYAERADNMWEDSVLIQDIFALIFRAKIVVCDFSRRNPNVFYEAGIAHTLGKHVVPITQTGEDIPFDLRHHRFLTYHNNGEGREGLQKELTKRLKTLKAK